MFLSNTGLSIIFKFQELKSLTQAHDQIEHRSQAEMDHYYPHLAARANLGPTTLCSEAGEKLRQKHNKNSDKNPLPLAGFCRLITYHQSAPF